MPQGCAPHPASACDDPSRLRYFSFIDFYGTLVTGDREAVEATCARVVDDLGVPLTPSALAEAWGHCFFDAIELANDADFLTLYDLECLTLRRTLAPWITKFDPTPYAEMLKRYWSDPPEAEGAAETLRSLTLPVCVVSNADTADVHAAIARRGFEVDAVVTSEDARSYKPHAGIFRMALERMGVTADRVMHAGDSLHSDVSGGGCYGHANVLGVLRESHPGCRGGDSGL
jgi:2-haloacid dehalogenase